MKLLLYKLMSTIFVYLSGSIKKSNSEKENCQQDDESKYWTTSHIEQLKECAGRSGIALVFLNPARRSDDLSDELSLFGRDMLQVAMADFVLVDGRNKRGIGIGYEIAFANFKGIPVITWCPFNTHYRQESVELCGQRLSKWTHPFISQTGRICEALGDIVDTIKNSPKAEKALLASSDFPYRAIKHYLSTQLHRDGEMAEIVSKYGKPVGL